MYGQAAPHTPPPDSANEKSRTGETGDNPCGLRTLFNLVTGDVARITRIRGGGPRSIRQRLLDMGVTRGTLVEVRRHAPLGDPVEVVIKGYYLALRMQEAREIEVEEVR